MLAQISVAAKTAVNSMGFGQVGVPEIFVGLLSKKGSFLVRIGPVQLLRAGHGVNVDSKFFAVVIGQPIAHKIAVANNAISVKNEADGQESSCAVIAQYFGLIGGREGHEHFMGAGDGCVCNLDASGAEGLLTSVCRCNDAIFISEATDINGQIRIILREPYIGMTIADEIGDPVHAHVDLVAVQLV